MAGAAPTPGDLAHMQRALELAERGWGRVSPNPLVGAVLVRDDAVVGEGLHTEYGQPHAEVEALRAAGERAHGATLYVSLEPCTHSGKTPPCTEAIIAAGVQRVVFGAADPNPRAGGGAEALRRAGIEVVAGIAAEAARRQNEPFFFSFSERAERRPWLALKLALSLDARVADSRNRSRWLTGRAAREEVHRLRAGFDAIAVGIGTALADDPQLTVRGPVRPRRPPIRIVFDRLLRLPAAGYLAATAREVPVWVVCGEEAPAERRRSLERGAVRVIAAADLESGLTALRAQGVASLFCEGGPVLGSALLDADLVDRLYLFYAPLLLGSGGRPAFPAIVDAALADARRWTRIEMADFGPDVLLTLGR